MMSAAEEQVIANAAQKEQSLNVQALVDKHTKDLKVRSEVFFVVVCFLLIICRGFFPVDVISKDEALLDVLSLTNWHNG